MVQKLSDVWSKNRSLEKLINIGPKVAGGLREIGVQDEHALRKLGAVEAFQKLRYTQKHWDNLMLLYALQGALLDLNCNHLPEEIKGSLKRAVGR